VALDIFIKIEGIDGETTQAGVVGQGIQVLAWSWGMSSSSSFSPGTAGFSAGKPNLQDLSFTKYTDATTCSLQTKLLFGGVLPKVELFMLKQTGEAGERVPYFTLTLTNAFITSMSLGGSGGEDRTTENVTLGFQKYELAYKKADAADQKKLVNGGDAAFDLAQQK
jgi:type VI secretion system secreted protein Hcp